MEVAARDDTLLDGRCDTTMMTMMMDNGIAIRQTVVSDFSRLTCSRDE